MIVLDTTVLVYATGGEHPLRAPCRRLVGLLGEGALVATTTVEVVQEYAHVRARRVARTDAVLQARAFTDLLGPLQQADEQTLFMGLELFAEHARLGSFDAVLAATALAAGARALVSADRAFGVAPGLLHVVPDDAGIDALLTV